MRGDKGRKGDVVLQIPAGSWDEVPTIIDEESGPRSDPDTTHPGIVTPRTGPAAPGASSYAAVVVSGSRAAAAIPSG